MIFDVDTKRKLEAHDFSSDGGYIEREGRLE